MAVVSFALNDAIDGLITTLQAATGFRAPTEAGSDIPVFDGAYPNGGSNFSCVVVGSDGDPNSVQRPGRLTSDWHDLDLTTDETGKIQCAIVVWSGDANPTTFGDQRSDALDILQDVDTALRSSVAASSLGVASLLWSKIDSAELIQYATEKGTVTRLPFTFSYRALLQVT